ncbi:enoyl-CoA hydratase [Neobacillus pocheonensis]|uniref:Enoyl-CoA hydratase n=1 Tax=Neobacillus pocheonensis TaxID=363869 RepID=A0ABT0WD97_9BACI|nr:enoyl-CoA hydratase [Neobacillus pocheonensis]
MTFVKVEKQEKIAILTIDNPPVNSFGAAVQEELGEVYADLIADHEVTAIILTGAGQKIFVAGANIKEIPNMLGNPDFVPKGKVNDVQELFNFIDYASKPTIAVLNGHALGGGCELALCCDIRIAEEHVLIGVPEVKLGLLPGAGGTQRLPRLIGQGKAKELLFTGEHISAEEALRIGLVNRVVPAGEGLQTALKLAKKITSNPPSAVRNIKKAVDESLELSFIEALVRESELFQELLLTEDAVEGVQAFIQKRVPQFKGR